MKRPAIEAIMLKLKRAYEDIEPDDFRTLVDRLWPRGATKAAAKIGLWFKGRRAEPRTSHVVRHDPSRWTEFRRLYFAEIKQRPADVARLRTLVAKQPVMFVYAAKDSDTRTRSR